MGSRWLISAVARIFQPGCKADCCLILEGPQGIKKSTTLRTLAEPWFIDHIPELGTKDSLIQVHSAWVIELAELESISRAEVGSIKQFISTQTDTFRPPYGKRASDFPRQCVFAGSVNNNTYLRDETGGRRFWPVKCLATGHRHRRSGRGQGPIVGRGGVSVLRGQDVVDGHAGTLRIGATGTGLPLRG